MNYSKKSKIAFFSVLCIILCSFLNVNFIFPVSSYYVSEDFVYSFSAPVITFDADNFTIFENYEYAKNYSEGNFSSSFLNQNDTIGVLPDYVTETYPSYGDVTIISQFSDHYNVLKVDDTSASYFAEAEIDFPSSQEYGSIEFYFATSDCTPDSAFYCESSTAYGGCIAGIKSEDFFYWDGTYNYLSVGAVDNTFYHIRMDFECGTNNYMGLSPDTFNLYINGNLYDNLPFVHSESSLLRFATKTIGASTQDVYVDALGFDFLDNYSIGQNIGFDYVNNTNILCNPKQTFYLNENLTNSYLAGGSSQSFDYTSYGYELTETTNDLSLIQNVNGNHYNGSLDPNDMMLNYLGQDTNSEEQLEIDYNSLESSLMYSFDGYCNLSGGQGALIFGNTYSGGQIVFSYSSGVVRAMFFHSSGSDNYYFDNDYLNFNCTILINSFYEYCRVIDKDSGDIFISINKHSLSIEDFQGGGKIVFQDQCNFSLDNLRCEVDGYNILGDYGALRIIGDDLDEMCGDYISTDAIMLGLLNVNDDYILGEYNETIIETTNANLPVYINDFIPFSSTLILISSGSISQLTNNPSYVNLYKNGVFECSGETTFGSNVSSSSGFFTDEDDMLTGLLKYEGNPDCYIYILFNIEDFKTTDYFLKMTSGYSTSLGIDSNFGIHYIDQTYDEINIYYRVFTDYFISLPPYLWVDYLYLRVNYTDMMINGSYSITGFQSLTFNYIQSNADTYDGEGILGTLIALIVIIVPTLVIITALSKSKLSENMKDFKIIIFYVVFFLMCTLSFVGGIIPLWLYFISILTNGIMIIARKRLDD